MIKNNVKIFKKTLQFYQNKHNDKSPMKIKNIFMLSMLCGCSLSFGKMPPPPENMQFHVDMPPGSDLNDQYREDDMREMHQMPPAPPADLYDYNDFHEKSPDEKEKIIKQAIMASYRQTKDIRPHSGNAGKFRHGNSLKSGALPPPQHFGNRPPPPPNFGNVPPPPFMSKQMMEENCKKIELAKGVLQQTKEACNKKDVSSAILSFIEYWILKEELLFSNSPMAFCNKSGKNGDLTFADANGIDQREAEDHNNRPQSVLSIQEEDNKQ